ncbi:hypothetical protein P153DRAFT_377535 [Dothidotthia symphoricarpi CBS 119687]|uniref:Uncharacterized protein n=1 Tax=Dothidotthia symphoricarpi CBS 119687 TaxID=1392245 RepID=A0A6A6A5N2_9PLEO|nr:uncharacterized protein P153DRAFT_377535 [Dothidotthia symphoricarpi CBS 119687]KAF2127282.1 hypothetical protein P153DRAFT_377535 [Dothidotthia symphoricarpi CBS 119687]
MAATRLRRTFQYPSESDDEDAVEQGMDEQASFLATAYTLYFLPLPPIKPGILETPDPGTARNKGKAINRGSYGYNVVSTPEQAATTGRIQTPYISEEIADLLAQYIVPMNAAVCGILAVHELWQRRAWSEGMMIGGGYLPGLILTTILWARRELRVMDLGELERLRYRSKGI